MQRIVNLLGREPKQRTFPHIPYLVLEDSWQASIKGAPDMFTFTLFMYEDTDEDTDEDEDIARLVCVQGDRQWSLERPFGYSNKSTTQYRIALQECLDELLEEIEWEVLHARPRPVDRVLFKSFDL